MYRPRVMIAWAAVGGCLSACAIGGIPGDGLLCLAPALLLLSALLARRYPGERLLLALATRRRRLRPRTASARRPAPAGAPTMPRGGLLMAFSLAVRPPPACSAAS